MPIYSVILEKRLSEEASTISGYLLPMPSETGQATPGVETSAQALENQLKTLGGQLATVPSATQDWQAAGSRITSQQEWMARRLGMDVPAAQVALRSDVGMSILNACGIPPELVISSRRQWRERGMA